MKTIYYVCLYKNKLAIFDSISKVYYFGYKNRFQAEKACQQLNQESHNESV